MCAYIVEYATAEFLGFFLYLAGEAYRRAAAALFDDLVERVERTAADKQNIFRIYLNELLVRMLAPALRR